jgi:hypothetical protein
VIPIRRVLSFCAIWPLPEQKGNTVSSQKKQPGQPGKQNRGAGKSRGRRRKGMTLDDRPILQPDAAGIDIGAREIFVAVPADRDENPVRVFPTFTADLEEMAKWLLSCRVTTVAM